MLDLSKLNLAEKQRQIVETALELFQKFGIKRIPVEEICRTSGVSKMTFYKYYKNKNELVRYIWERGYAQAMEKFEAIKQMDVPFTEKLDLMLKLKDETTTKISHQFALDYIYASSDLKGFFEELSLNSITNFLDFLKDAQKKGEMRSDLRPEFIMAVINNIKLMVKDDDLISLYPNYHDFVMEANNFLFYGILSKPDTGKS